MRHRNAGRRLARTLEHRKALGRNLARAMFFQFGTDREYIVTTLPKAKEYKPLIERIITLGKKGGLANRRLALHLLPDDKVVHKVFAEVAPRYAERKGGYTRIVRTGAFRKGDGTRKVLLQFVKDETKEAAPRPKAAGET